MIAWWKSISLYTR